MQGQPFSRQQILSDATRPPLAEAGARQQAASKTRKRSAVGSARGYEAVAWALQRQHRRGLRRPLGRGADHGKDRRSSKREVNTK